MNRKFNFIKFLPNDMLKLILSYCSFEELDKSRLVSKVWRKLVRCVVNARPNDTFPRKCGHCHCYIIDMKDYAAPMCDRGPIMCGYLAYLKPPPSDNEIFAYINSMGKVLVIGDIVVVNGVKLMYTNGDRTCFSLKGMRTENIEYKFVGVTAPFAVKDTIPFPSCYWKNYCKFDNFSKKTMELMRWKNENILSDSLPEDAKQCSTLDKTLIHYSGISYISISITDPQLLDQIKSNIDSIDFGGSMYLTTYFDWGGYTFTLAFDKVFPRNSPIPINLFAIDSEVKLHYTPKYVALNTFDHDILFIEVILTHTATDWFINYVNDMQPNIHNKK